MLVNIVVYQGQFMNREHGQTLVFTQNHLIVNDL